MIKKAEAEFIAPQYLKIVIDCANLVNTTKNPRVFFERYELLYQKLHQLIEIENYVKFKGDKPSVLLRNIQQRRTATINDFLNRYYDDISSSLMRLKTQKAKENKADEFLRGLVLYNKGMNEENENELVRLYTKLKELCLITL